MQRWFPPKPQDPQNIAREKKPGAWVQDLLPAQETPPEQKIAQNSVLCFWTGLHAVGAEDWGDALPRQQAGPVAAAPGECFLSAAQNQQPDQFGDD